MENTQVIALARLKWLLTRVDKFLSGRRLWIVALLAVSVGVVKHGVSLSAPGFGQIFSLESWPYPVDQYPYQSYGVRAVAWTFGIEDQRGYLAIGLILSLLMVVLIVWRISTSLTGRDARLAVLLLLSGPVIWVLAGRLIHTDALVLAGAIVFGFSGKRIPWALGAAGLCLLGAPEQSVAIFLGTFTLSLASRFRAWRAGALAGLILSLVVAVALNIWAGSVGVETRAALLPELLKRSIEIGLTNGPITIYTGYGLAGLLIIWAALDESRREAAIVLVACVFIPVGLTLMTSDQTRILVITSVATISMLIRAHTHSLLTILDLPGRVGLGVIAAAVIFLPALQVQGREIPSPWATFFFYFQSYVVESFAT